MNIPVPAYMARIRSQIRDAETKADESLLAKLTVMSSILRARQVEDLPAPHVGQEAIIRLGRAIQSDISGANDVFRSHNALVDDKTLITGMPGHDDTQRFSPTTGEGGRQATA
ncbi:hypothetical protein [Sphingopyxis macrogoltabida]|uniref:Uncharacterized protein n=1 Tax=Sphingopyxis macrogoltabida TaxID=33050 RepID=A0AAC9FGS2_SPHMC|nr:hypothetical protein [Sphingopyxis macrogoltabida]ALJ15618.1 hypothetical protein LH19_22315 [Sphingopyxis macrogoltabida]AMU91858.1 hypothetical protein ATM17_22865 [Sphingopyxis macrogoltabida]